MLAIDVIPEPEKVAAEMRRVTRPGGVVACGTFDFWGGFTAADMLMDTGAVLDEGLRKIRDFLRSRPLARANGQAELWNQTTLPMSLTVPLVVSFDFGSFDDY